MKILHICTKLINNNIFQSVIIIIARHSIYKFFLRYKKIK